MGSETDKNRLICYLLFSEMSENTRVTLIILTCCECGVFFNIQTVLIEKMQMCGSCFACAIARY